jgi:hypothetical protein
MGVPGNWGFPSEGFAEKDLGRTLYSASTQLGTILGCDLQVGLSLQPVRLRVGGLANTASNIWAQTGPEIVVDLDREPLSWVVHGGSCSLQTVGGCG